MARVRHRLRQLLKFLKCPRAPALAVPPVDLGWVPAYQYSSAQGWYGPCKDGLARGLHTRTLGWGALASVHDRSAQAGGREPRWPSHWPRALGWGGLTTGKGKGRQVKAPALSTARLSCQATLTKRVCSTAVPRANRKASCL